MYPCIRIMDDPSHGFESHLHPFLLTYPEAGLSLDLSSVFKYDMEAFIPANRAACLIVKIGYRTEVRALMLNCRAM